MVIHKHPLSLSDVSTVLLPEGAQVLHVAMQRGVLMLWTLEDLGRKQETRYFKVIATGEAIPQGATIKHVGTALDDRYVWHVFEPA